MYYTRFKGIFIKGIIVDGHCRLTGKKVVTVPAELASGMLLQLFWHCDRAQCIFRRSDLTVYAC